MSDTFDHEADAWDSLNDEELNDEELEDVVQYMAGHGWNGARPLRTGSLSCNRCGSVNVYWQRMAGQYRLLSTLTDELHVCPIKTDAFDAIPED